MLYVVQWNVVCCFANKHTKHIQIITWLQLDHPFFAQWSTVCTKQNTLIIYHVCHDVRLLCQKWEWFFIEHRVKSQLAVLVGYLTVSINVSCYQTHCGCYVFHQCSAPVLGACDKVQLLQHKTQLHNFISPQLCPPTAQSWTRLITSRELYSSLNMSCVSILKKSSSHLAELWQGSDTAFEWKDMICMFPCLAW